MGRLLLLAALCAHLAACGGGGSPPVINKSPHRVIPAEIAALAGDSVYSIAWRFGLDYQKIAKWNRLGKPYRIRAGQRVRLRPLRASESAPVAEAAPSPPKPAAVQPTTPPKATPAAAPGKWNWPAKGKIIGTFSRGKGRSGIQIAGLAGSAIRSTAAGEVVYAGEGLRGYGKLIIVKHSSTYLSAYAHNQAMLVAEGKRIKSGQQIARMGNNGAGRTMLHFEIRKNGKPVDPLQLLN